METFTHTDDTRVHIPSAEHESLMRDEETSPVRLAYQRRNRDLDPQLVWRGKDEQDLSDLVVNAPPRYIQGEDPPQGAHRGPDAPDEERRGTRGIPAQPLL